MTLKSILAVALVVPTTLAATSFDYIPDPRLQVNAVDSDSFEVIERRGAGAPDIWCAAARYANRTLGVYDGRLSLERARGPAQTANGSTGAVFTLASLDGDFTALTAGVRKAGQSMRVSQAARFCDAYVPGGG